MANDKTLIYKEDLLDVVLGHFGVDLAYLGEDLQFCQEAIDMAPVVEAEEVVHGRWIWGVSNHHEWMKCSECLVSQTPTGVFTYCPNCGAKMEGDGNG